MADKAVIGVVTSRRNESGELVVNPNIQGFIERAGAERRRPRALLLRTG